MRKRELPLDSGSSVTIVEADDVVLTEIGARLNLDHLKLNLPWILQAMSFAPGRTTIRLTWNLSPKSMLS